MGSLLRAATDNWDLADRDPETGGFRYRVDGARRTASTVDEIVTDIDGELNGSVKLKRDGLTIYAELNYEKLPTLNVSNLYLWTDEYSFYHDGEGRTQVEARRNVETYLDLVETAVEATDPGYGFGKHMAAVSPRVVPTADDIYDSRYRDVFWLNIFDEAAVNSIGRETVMDAPAWRVTELDTGHVLVVAAGNPIQPDSRWDGATERVKEHLGIGD
jgi:hypothetical protein